MTAVITKPTKSFLLAKKKMTQRNSISRNLAKAAAEAVTGLSLLAREEGVSPNAKVAALSKIIDYAVSHVKMCNEDEIERLKLELEFQQQLLENTQTGEVFEEDDEEEDEEGTPYIDFSTVVPVTP